MSARGSAPNRESIGNISLPPEKAARLKREVDERDRSASILVEKAVDMLFAKWDADAPAAAPKPAVAHGS